MQSDSMKKVADALQGLLNAASVNSADKAKVQALLQSQSEDQDQDLELQPAGAPDPAASRGAEGRLLSRGCIGVSCALSPSRTIALHFLRCKEARSKCLMRFALCVDSAMSEMEVEDVGPCDSSS